MSRTTRNRRGRGRWLLGLGSLIVAMALPSCRGDGNGLAPELPGNPPKNPQIRSASFIVDVNTRTKKISIAAPTVQTGSVSVDMGKTAPAGGPQLSVAGGVPGPNFSIIAGDVVELTANDYTASAVGAFTPGRVRVSFDVSITNRLAGVELITSTFPAPPAGVTGVMLFPYETVVTTTAGGVQVGGDGTDVLVEQPNYGAVSPSVEWGGAPHNFFNDTGCPAGSNDCYRYEVFAQPLASGATSEEQRVGFDIDPTVGNFRARLIVAADLHNSGPAPTGSVVGSVTSPQRGALSGVTVNVNPGSFTVTTSGSGAYSITNVNIGPRTVTLTNLPAGCTNPGAQSATVTNGGTATVNFTVTCTVPAGTIGGTISSSLGGGIAGVSVTVTPNAQPAMTPVSSNGSGSYSVANVPVAGTGTGSIALGNLPGLCTNPGAIPYTGLADGGTITVNVTVACAPAPSGYQYTSTWGAITGGQVTLTIRVDLSTFDDPGINGAGADDIDAIQGSVGYDGARLQFVSGANVAGAGMQNITASDPTESGTQIARVNFINYSTAPAGTLHTGLQGVAVLTFNVLAGSGSSTTATTLDTAASDSGADLLPHVIVTEGTISIP